MYINIPVPKFPASLYSTVAKVHELMVTHRTKKNLEHKNLDMKVSTSIGNSVIARLHFHPGKLSYEISVYRKLIHDTVCFYSGISFYKQPCVNVYRSLNRMTSHAMYALILAGMEILNTCIITN